MKSRKLALAVLFLVGFGHVQAQEYAFKVLVNKGKNELKSGATWTPIKVGATLKPEDQLKVAENSYLGLVRVSSGKPLEMKKPGTYSVLKLKTEMDAQPSNSVLNKYTDFILSSATSPKNTLSATGAVDRGILKIDLNLPGPSTEHAEVFGKKVIVSWVDEKKLKPYMVTFNNMFGDELLSKETSDTWIEVDLTDPALSHEDAVLVKVTSKTDKNRESEVRTIKKVSKANRDKIGVAYNEFAAANAEQTAINKLLLAGFYEQHDLLIDAGTALQEAAKMEPEVYKDLYNEFLLRSGIRKKRK